MRISEELFFVNELLGDLISMREHVEEQIDKTYKRSIELSSLSKVAESLEEVVMR